MILVTGANGFVGSALCPALVAAGYEVRGAVRDAAAIPSSAGIALAVVGDVNETTDWRAALSGVSCVIHLAARAHIMDANAASAFAQYRRINVEGSRRLAEEAARAGVQRFLYVSSIKVNGESTNDHPFTEQDVPHPQDAYGVSKWEAERALATTARNSGMELIILRPPLVYGPGVKGNFLRLLGIIARGMPLPFASIENRRSLIYVGNLVDAILSCVAAPAAAGQTYVVSDDEDVSTPELVRRLAVALGVHPRLVPFPPTLLALGARVLGKGAEVARLAGSLQVDSSKIRTGLGWQPPVSLADGIRRTAEWYRATRGRKP